MSDVKWKSRLLSSSLPLEFEAAKILHQQGFVTTYDYLYSRNSGSEEKDFSIDLKSVKYIDIQERLISINALVECKFRETSKKWVFLPEISNAEMSVFTLGCTLNTFSEFSTIQINNQPLYDFESSFEFGLKGTEINLTTGETFDKDIIHGISQLKYGLPYLIRNCIMSNCYHYNDAAPFFVFPILLTNAELYIFDETFSIDAVKNTDSLMSICKKVPYIIHYSEPGPDFIKHHKSIFESFSEIIKDNKGIDLFEKFHLQKKELIYPSAIETIKSLEESSPGFDSDKYYSQYFICTVDSFSDLIEAIVKNINRTLIKAKKTNKK